MDTPLIYSLTASLFVDSDEDMSLRKSPRFGFRDCSLHWSVEASENVLSESPFGWFFASSLASSSMNVGMSRVPEGFMRMVGARDVGDMVTG